VGTASYLHRITAVEPDRIQWGSDIQRDSECYPICNTFVSVAEIDKQRQHMDGDQWSNIGLA
jgi:hypothetical protein